MKRILSLVILAPVGVLLIVLSVANRHDVTLRLDPFNAAEPALALTLPFFVFVFAALLVGLVIGGAAVWFRQGRFRRDARRRRIESIKWRTEAETQKKRADELAQAAVAPGSSLQVAGGRERVA